MTTALDHYQLIEEIGHGGMSTVWKAIDITNNQMLAIKVLHPFLANRADCRARLEREAQAISQLNHPNILKIIGLSSNKELYLAMELVEGITLKQFAPTHELHRSPELCALIIWKLAKALSLAHSKNIIHRDLKPENIMVRQDGCLKLMDFGLALLANQESLTLSGHLMGSPAHMAPEIIEGHSASEQSDVFSLATVLYWMVTNQLPFDAPNPTALLRNILEGKYEPPQKINPAIGDDLAQIIAKGMSKDLKNRFLTIKEMTDAIETSLRKIDLICEKVDLDALLSGKANSFEQSVYEGNFKAAKRALQSGNNALAMSYISRILSRSPDDHETNLLLTHLDPTYKTKRQKLIISLASLSGVSLVATILFIYNWHESPPSHENSAGLSMVIPGLVPGIQAQSDAGGLDSGNKSRNDHKLSVVEPEKIPTPPELVTLPIEVTPFADIYVNDKLVASNSRFAAPVLEPGKHSVVFKHRYAATVERTITIKRGQKKADAVRVALDRPKPARLIVMSNLEADLAIDGVYKGTTKQSQTEPILVPLPVKTHAKEHEILLSKAGYEPFMVNRTLVAGETLVVKATLSPSPAGGRRIKDEGGEAAEHQY